MTSEDALIAMTERAVKAEIALAKANRELKLLRPEPEAKKKA